jgi:di/tricarboxylate transporter
VGQRIFQSNLSKMGFRILNVIRNNNNFIPDDTTFFNANDLLIVEGDIDTLLKVKETVGIEIRADALIKQDLQDENIRLAELLVTPQCDFINTTIKGSNFRRRYGLVVLAVSRSGQTLKEKLGNITFRLGDIILVQGPAERINYYKSSPGVAIMQDFKPLLYKTRKGFFTLLVFVAAIVVGALQVTPLSVSLLIAMILVIINKAVNMDVEFESIDWRLLVLFGGMSAFGTAMTKSGTASFLSDHIINFCMPYGVNMILAGLIILTVILTQPMGNAAAALIVLPIAIQTALQLGVSIKPFVIGIMLSASVSLITPFEPSSILVYGPGKYSFVDFIRVGMPLTILLILVLMLMLPYFYPF